jgi:hypothetical protein
MEVYKIKNKDYTTRIKGTIHQDVWKYCSDYLDFYINTSIRDKVWNNSGMSEFYWFWRDIKNSISINEK